MDRKEVLEFTARMDRETKSAKARKTMAETALKYGRLTNCGRNAYEQYLEQF